MLVQGAEREGGGSVCERERWGGGEAVAVRGAEIAILFGHFGDYYLV